MLKRFTLKLNAILLLVSLSCWGSTLPIDAFNRATLAAVETENSNTDRQHEEADQLMLEGLRQYGLGQLRPAIATFESAALLYRAVGNSSQEAAALNNIGLASQDLGDFEQALNYLQQALVIARNVESQLVESEILDNLALVYANLGQVEQAVEFYQQALVIQRQLNNPSEESISLLGLGFAYERLEQYEQAITYYQQALVVQRSIGDRVGEAHTLNNMGMTYYYMGQSDLALQFLEESIAILQELVSEDVPGQLVLKGYAFNSLGRIYASLSRLNESWHAYQQSLKILTEVGDRSGQTIALSRIGDLLVQQNQPELAILFYKRSVNVTEAIRQDIEGLPIEYQQSYTNTVADTYRKLADLLLQQDRVLEAQQVLDLLKVQELDDYLHRVRGNEETAQGIDLLPQERSVIEQFDQQLEQAIEFGRELTELEAIPRDDRTPEQEQRLLELREKERQTRLAYNEFLSTPDVQTLIQQLRQTTAGQNIEPLDLISLRRNLGELQQDVVLLYPLILEDRLELVLSTPYAPPIHRAVPVGRVELNQAIAEFRSALGDSNSDPQPLAQQLYDWLIRPIEADLEQANAQTILYAPDGQLRYIPLAALHDGNHWAIERFRINNITALSLTNLTASPDAEPDVLAAAFATGRYNFERGGRRYGFSGLPFSEIEVERLANLYSDTTQLIDDAFNRNTTLNAINDYSIVHLATHAAFVTGQPDDSFILLGDGELITLRDIDELSLTNVDLMVLSGCQTGLGVLGNGEEILGFGYQIQEAGARAAIASLWSVDDGGTQVLMNQFYAVLNRGNVTKTAALQQAQIALINADATLELNTFSHSDVQALRHPYYWAGFILIGNGL